MTLAPSIPLEATALNLHLRRNLAEKEKMQAVLISTLQSLTTGALAVGNDGIVIVANPAACRLLDRPLEALATRQIAAVLGDVPGAAPLIDTLWGLGGDQTHLEWAPPPDADAPRHRTLTAVRAMAPYDRHLAGLILIEDISAVRRLEAEAQLRSRLTGMGEIALNLAHEIRNPLGSIALLASMLGRELADRPDLVTLADQILHGVQSLEHVVANTLEFARPRRVAAGRVNLAAILSETLLYVRHPLQEKAIRVQFDPDLRPAAWVAGDAEPLRQVFLNLVLNAIQAMDAGGVLTLDWQPGDPRAWTVTVADTGEGIPADRLERIFDPFFTTRRKGSGIGLAIVHRIVTAHRGRIAVESRPGEGTRFRLTLPAAAPPSPPEPDRRVSA